MFSGGCFDFIEHSGAMAVAKLKSCVIQPRASRAELMALIEFQEKFDVVVRYLLGDETVTIDDIITELGVDEANAAMLRSEVDSVRDGRGDLSNFISQLKEPVSESQDEITESALAGVGDFWTRYQIIQRIATVISSWEMRYDRSGLSQEGLRDLYNQLRTDFSHDRGLIRVIYENLIPRIERLMESIGESP